MITERSFLHFFRIQLLLWSACLFANNSIAQCITSFPNKQNFEFSNGGWSTGGNSSDWAWGTPSKPIISTAAGGAKCWISGGLNKNSYNNGELAWVKSPCYDLSTLKYPTVGFKVFWESEYNFDGTVFQYSTDNGNNWYDVGSYSDTKNCFNLNWFNTSDVKYLGGGGWSGSVGTGGGCGAGNGSNNWIIASHTMPYLAGKTSVQFRFLFGAGTNCNDYDGFAFDDFTIGDALPNFASFVYNCNGGNTVNFSGSALFCPKLTWDFGDPGSGAANTSNLSNPAHSFSGSGQFTVNLTATGPDNAPSIVTKVITILDLNTQIVNEPLCNGDMNGSVMVTPTPNIAGLNYSWNTSTVQQTATAINLGKGTYVVTVTGTNVCEAQDNITLNEPLLLSSSTITDQPTCNNNDGKITLGTTGGTAPYTYTWTPNISVTNIAANLAAGDYIVVVKDKNQCTENRSFKLAAPAGLNATITAKKDVTCNGDKNGSATVTVTGGTGPYTYAWAPSGGSNPTATLLSGNSYTVTIKDQAGCSTSASTTIAEPPALKSVMSSTDALCGNNNGTAAANITGGVLPYNYSWTPGAYSTASINNLAPKDYELTVTDKNGCQVTDVASIKATGTTINLQINHTDIKCFGDKTGNATVVITGGVSPYTITWGNGATGATVSNLAQGKYTVTVKDAAGCSSTTSIDIAEPAAALQVNLLATDALCNNGKGSIKSTVTGGTINYQYAWSNGSTAPDLSNANAGSYTLNITDNNGCKATANATIKEPSAFVVNMNTQPATCGNNNGSAAAIVSGGTAPYTYSWSPGNFNTANINNLSAAKYVLTVTDKNGCTQPATADILSSSAISLQISHTDIKCFGNKTGTATVVMTGGTAPYTTTWSNGATGAIASNLAKGNYSVTVKDAAGCSNTASVNIVEPAALQANLLATDALCNSGKGSIKSTVTGGTINYQYAWSNGSTSADLNNIIAGTYTLNITDNNGCKATASTNIKEPSALVVNMNTQAATCGNNNGSVTAIVSGGTTPYTYAWSPGNFNTAKINNLAAAKYVLTVTDKNGCTQLATADILSSSAIGLQINHTDIKCFGDKTGAATVVIAGGIAPYTITWNNGATGATASNLAKGKYTVTVEDAAGCSNAASVDISEPAAALNVSLEVTDAFCKNTLGKIISTTTGGTAPYQYVWTPAFGNVASLVNVPAGTYALNLTDNNGCKTATSATIKEATQIVTKLTIQNAACGSDNGSINAAISGGIAPYTYRWLPGNQTTAAINNLASGKYTLTVTDKNGCIANDTGIVTTPGNLLVQTSTTNINCSGDKNGSAAVTITGGSPAYSIVWSNGLSTPTISNLSTGNYTVTVKDATGCSSTKTFEIIEPAPINVLLDSVSAVCNNANGSIYAQATGGVLPYSYNWLPNNINSPAITHLFPGKYSVTVTDKNGCKKTASASIKNTNPLSISLGADTSICGTDKVSLSPGNFVSYSWQDGSNASSYNATQQGSYWVTVKDHQGCFAADTIRIVADCGEIWFPSAFTPNGDGKNETFGPLGNLSLISEFSFTVFNRWGEKVFESYDPSLKWNGKYKGLLTMGTYVWFARFSSRTGLKTTRKGTIVLVL